MSALSYNCRGLGSDATIREIVDFAKHFKPTVFCVLETQLHKIWVERLAGRLGYDRSFAVSSTGRSGGLGIFWNNEINVTILPYSQYHLDAIITERVVNPGGLPVFMVRLGRRRDSKLGIC